MQSFSEGNALKVIPTNWQMLHADNVAVTVAAAATAATGATAATAAAAYNNYWPSRSALAFHMRVQSINLRYALK